MSSAAVEMDRANSVTREWPIWTIFPLYVKYKSGCFHKRKNIKFTWTTVKTVFKIGNK